MGPASNTHAHRRKRTHTHLQHGEPSTCACAPSVCRRLDASAAPPHMAQTLSEQPGGGQFGLQCPAHPDSLTSHTANAGPGSDRNTPALAECVVIVESKARTCGLHPKVTFSLCVCVWLHHVSTGEWFVVFVLLTAKCKGLTGILLSTSSRQLKEISRSWKRIRGKIKKMSVQSKKSNSKHLNQRNHWPAPGAVCSHKLLHSGQHCNPYCSSELGSPRCQASSLNTWTHRVKGKLGILSGFYSSSTRSNERKLLFKCFIKFYHT